MNLKNNNRGIEILSLSVSVNSCIRKAM